MQLASLGSGSRGNATVVRSGETCLLVDLGFGVRETVKRLETLQLQPEHINACLVTHEHSDHIAGVAAFAGRFNIPVYATAGTRTVWESKQSLNALSIHTVTIKREFSLGGIKVTPVPVPHDAREPVQYVFDDGSVNLGILTDLGMVTPIVRQAYRGCSALLIEANHDSNMLRNGKYPRSLKQRVSGNWGHLNNNQTANFVGEICDAKAISHLIVGHISQQNNTPDLVANAMEEVTSRIPHVFYASQDSCLDWISLNKQT